MEITDADFEKLVGRAIDALPPKYGQRIDNLVFVTADEPDENQRTNLKLHCNQTLLGLYEGIPLPKRGSGYNLVLPDKITIFKNPLLAISSNTENLQHNIYKTVWHEVAHYFGLDHDQIHQRGGS